MNVMLISIYLVLKLAHTLCRILWTNAIQISHSSSYIGVLVKGFCIGSFLSVSSTSLSYDSAGQHAGLDTCSTGMSADGHDALVL
jgi:hypothetical protein